MNTYCRIILLILLSGIVLTVSLKLSAQNTKIKNIGLPFATAFGPAEYNAAVQNFDVVVGDDQRVYFGNNFGVLIHDGNDWLLVKLPNGSPAYSLVLGANGTIYVGGINEVGYLAPKPNGTIGYVSLNQHFGIVAEESFTSFLLTNLDEVIFSVFPKVIILNTQTDQFRIVDSPVVTGTEQSLKNTFHIFEDNLFLYSADSLFQLKEEGFRAIRPSKIYDYNVYGKNHFIETDSGSAFNITQNGFFDWQTDQEIAIDDKVRNILSATTCYDAKLISNKYLFICTWNGLLITDVKGHFIQHLTKKNGFLDFIFVSALDELGMLWVAANNGIMKIDITSPYSILDNRMNVDGIITSIARHKGNLYLSSTTGMYRTPFNDATSKQTLLSFEKIDSRISHGLINTEEDLIVFTEYEKNLTLNNQQFEEIEGTVDGMFWAGIKYQDTNDLLLGSREGHLLHLTKESEKWTVKKEIETDFLSARYLLKDKGNTVWVSDLNEGVYKLTYDRDQSILMEERKYDEANGLPSGLNNYPFIIDSQPLFATEAGPYRYNESSDRFERDEELFGLIGETAIWLMTQDEHGNIYYIDEELIVLKKTAEGYVKKTFPNLNLLEYPMYSLLSDDNSNVFLGSVDAMIHVDPTATIQSTICHINITHMSSLSTDSVFYGGYGKIPEGLGLAYSDNDIRIRFSSFGAINPEKTQYRWRLTKQDQTWSDWSSDQQKDYTNLPYGNHTFEVMARNVYGTESEISSLTFSISTPWYFTYWAYCCYLLLLAAFIWALVRLNIRRLLLDKKKLEGIIIDRTQEIVAQKDQLIAQDELKNRFFLNISHELRTPLTLSLGTVERTLEGKFGKLSPEMTENLHITKRNNHRLLKMVNNILDVSKLKGGQAQIKATLIHPKVIIDKVLDFFSSKFANKTINIQAAIDQDTALYLDKDMFETMLMNLMSNAYKFTPEGGSITIGDIIESETVTYFVRDTGMGIPEEHLANVFDRFYQTPHAMNDEGTGLGLALTKELVTLHHGTITVESVVNKETTFKITFKKGKDHLSATDLWDATLEESGKSLDEKYPLYERPESKEVSTKDQDVDAERLHILVVEDNPEMGQYISDILLDSGYRITLAENGQEGLDFLATEKPDLILTDWLMPVMDGFEMASIIKRNQDWAFIPMLFLTARADEQDKINVLNLGVDDYLYKPFSTDELFIRVKNLLSNKKHRSEYIEEQGIDSSQIEWKDFDSKIKQDIDAYIRENIKSEINSNDLAKIAGHSERSLYRKVKSNTGLSLMMYVKEFRLRQARRLLENKELATVSEVAYAVGFNYLSHFTKNYKERFGKQPSEYLS